MEDTKNAILRWYAFSEAGAVRRCAAVSASVRPAVDLDDPSAVVGLFAEARELDQSVDACGWKHLFGRYGLVGLIELAKRRGGFPDDTPDASVADALIAESREAGFEPGVSLLEVIRQSGGTSRQSLSTVAC